MEQFSSHMTNFHEILYLSNFQKCVEKIQVLLKSNELRVIYMKMNNIYDHKVVYTNIIFIHHLSLLIQKEYLEIFLNINFSRPLGNFNYTKLQAFI